ncbi:hypothetical protein GCM10007304_36530 [Rhodococcoides trifolii]|uniref:Pilus biosynthesis protein TadE n=1 Tax=Rhodococcoides trifolii TaxID=908250 RepID=A0A917G2I2_9NOCA|nr:TadE family type IV pilus minor pilin [Rhodococcus trifolii]GGG19306.1 hypothetical protein GCM10007304_36530 [Rhodococcus trifolii]
MTVEAALAISSIIAVVVLCLGAVSTVTAHIRCVDAAREAARLAARGDTASATAAAAAVAPRDARIDIRDDGTRVIARVVASSPFPSMDVTAEAVAVKELPDAGR